MLLASTDAPAPNNSETFKILRKTKLDYELSEDREILENCLKHSTAKSIEHVLSIASYFPEDFSKLTFSDAKITAIVKKYAHS